YARKQTPARRNHERGPRIGERFEELCDGGIALVVVEHDQALGPVGEKALQPLDAAFAAAGAEPQREHLGQRVEPPCGGAEPVDAALERVVQTVPELGREHRLAAPARTDEREARRARREDRARERLDLGAPALQVERPRRKDRAVLETSGFVGSSHPSLAFGARFPFVPFSFNIRRRLESHRSFARARSEMSNAPTVLTELKLTPEMQEAVNTAFAMRRPIVLAYVDPD